MSPETIAGTISTAMFAMGNVPMLVKAVRTRSLSSYSHAQLLTNGSASLIHWVYISGLPFGPIWFLHGFYTIATGIMVILFLHYEGSGIPLLRGRPLGRLLNWRDQPRARLGHWVDGLRMWLWLGWDRSVSLWADASGAMRSVSERCDVLPTDPPWSSSPELTLS